jgi:tetratricopeptide (TPR) repeat protein
MITRDEEHCIGQALRSIKDLVKEIIVIDTGSTDQTISIAKSLGARVFEHPWENDFATPRNISLKHATGDWILVLDADEAIAKEDHHKLREHIKKQGVCYEFMQRHYSNDARLSNYSPCRGIYKKWEKNYLGYFESNCCRLFPNHAGLNFQGKIHELVEHSINQLAEHKIVHLNIPIHHYGHTPEIKALKNKRELYSDLGKKKIQSEPDSWKNYYEMGVEHNCNGKLQESVDCFKKALEKNPRYIPSWTNLGYVLCELGRHAEALQTLNKAITIDPNACEAHCNLAVVYMRQRNWVFAETHLKKAIQLKPDYINAIRNLGQVYMNARAFTQAAQVFNKVLELIPGDPTSQANLATVLLLNGNTKTADKLFHEVLSKDPENSQACFHLGQLYKAQGKANEARDLLEKFCTIEESKASAQSNPELLNAITQIRQECQKLIEPEANSPLGDDFNLR